MRIALVCVAKNEDRYIDEWIKYNFKLGFNDIYIYHNDWEFEYEHPNVHLTPIKGKGIQRFAYNDCYQKIKWVYDWVAFFDIDEFLVLHKHETIGDFLSEYNHHPAVGINWLLFGDNNLNEVNDSDYGLIERFTRRQNSVNPHVKSIVNTSYAHNHIDVHTPNSSVSDTNHKEFSGPYNHEGPIDVAQLNHYFCKTIEEFREKVDRGRADHHAMIRKLSEFDDHNFNDVEDFTARDFMYDNK
jgi:hypothetical protein